jgi:manganese/iron transport system substrate-binding protein
MVPDGTDSHTFEPRPSDARFLQDADLIVLNGLHLETPTQQLADANKRPETPYLMLGDRTITPDDWVFDFSFPASAGDPNPHLWTNPPYAKRYAMIIRDELTQLDSENAGTYHANYEAFAARIDALDAAVRTATATVPACRSASSCTARRAGRTTTPRSGYPGS